MFARSGCFTTDAAEPEEEVRKLVGVGPSCRSPSAPQTAPPAPTEPAPTRSPVNPRHLTFRPRPQYETQHSIRTEQATDAWRDRYAHRSGIEGTIAQASRRSDLHLARYRGLARPTWSMC